MEGESERLIPSSYFLFQSFTSKTWWRSDHRRRCKPCIHYAMRVWDVKQKMLVNIKCGSLWMWNRKCWYVCVVKEGSKGSIEWKRMAIFPFAYVAYSNWTTCTSVCTAAVKLKKETWKMSHRVCLFVFFFGFSSPLSRNKQHIFVIKQIQQIVANTELVPVCFLPQVLCTPTHVHEYIEVSKLLYQNLIQIESPTILGHVHQGKKRCVGRI